MLQIGKPSPTELTIANTATSSSREGEPNTCGLRDPTRNPFMGFQQVEEAHVIVPERLGANISRAELQNIFTVLDADILDQRLTPDTATSQSGSSTPLIAAADRQQNDGHLLVDDSACEEGREKKWNLVDRGSEQAQCIEPRIEEFEPAAVTASAATLRMPSPDLIKEEPSGADARHQSRQVSGEKDFPTRSCSTDTRPDERLTTKPSEYSMQNRFQAQRGKAEASQGEEWCCVDAEEGIGG